MADTLTTIIPETFGLIAVEEYGGKVRLWQSSQRKAWLDENIVKAQDGLEQLCLKETTDETSHDDTCTVCCPSVGSVCDDIAFCSETQTSLAGVGLRLPSDGGGLHCSCLPDGILE